MNTFTLNQLKLPDKQATTKNFLTRQQIMERNKKNKEHKAPHYQSRKIQKPQSVAKLSIQKPSTKKRIFSCSKLQLNELIPDYPYLPKKRNEPLNSDYFNFVTKVKQVLENEETSLTRFNVMKEELLQSFKAFEASLL